MRKSDYLIGFIKQFMNQAANPPGDLLEGRSEGGCKKQVFIGKRTGQGSY